eukprot:6462813-Amphidinium_carterae.1
MFDHRGDSENEPKYFLNKAGSHGVTGADKSQPVPAIAPPVRDKAPITPFAFFVSSSLIVTPAAQRAYTPCPENARKLGKCRMVLSRKNPRW